MENFTCIERKFTGTNYKECGFTNVTKNHNLKGSYQDWAYRHNSKGSLP